MSAVHSCCLSPSGVTTRPGTIEEYQGNHNGNSQPPPSSGEREGANYAYATFEAKVGFWVSCGGVLSGWVRVRADHPSICAGARSSRQYHGPDESAARRNRETTT